MDEYEASVWRVPNAGAETTGEPGALLRGGHFGSKTEAGPLAIDAAHQPSDTSDRIGFRCVR